MDQKDANTLLVTALENIIGKCIFKVTKLDCILLNIRVNLPTCQNYCHSLGYMYVMMESNLFASLLSTMCVYPSAGDLEVSAIPTTPYTS